MQIQISLSLLAHAIQEKKLKQNSQMQCKFDTSLTRSIPGLVSDRPPMTTGTGTQECRVRRNTKYSTILRLPTEEQRPDKYQVSSSVCSSLRSYILLPRITMPCPCPRTLQRGIRPVPRRTRVNTSGTAGRRCYCARVRVGAHAPSPLAARPFSSPAI